MMRRLFVLPLVIPLLCGGCGSSTGPRGLPGPPGPAGPPGAPGGSAALTAAALTGEWQGRYDPDQGFLVDTVGRVRLSISADGRLSGTLGYQLPGVREQIAPVTGSVSPAGPVQMAGTWPTFPQPRSFTLSGSVYPAPGGLAVVLYGDLFGDGHTLWIVHLWRGTPG